MHSTGEPVSQSGVGYVVQFCSFSHWHLIFLQTESRHLSVHHGCRPFWGSEICSGAEFVEVLSQKRTRNTHKKRHKNVFYSKIPSYKKSILK